MEMLVRVAVITVAGAIIGLVIKKNNPEASLLLTIATSAFSMYLAFDVVTSVVNFIRSLSETAEISPAVLAVVLKTVGVAVITKISSDVCRDAGQSGAASGVEFAGTVTAIYVSLPLMESVIRMLNSLI